MRSRRIATAAALVVGVIVAVGAGASPALAAGEAHPYLNISFGHNATEAFSNPNGIAVDESTGDVYVADLGSSTVPQSVSKFESNGKPVAFSASEAYIKGSELTSTPTGSFSFPNVSGNPAAIAVDNACVLHTPALAGAACTQFDPSAGDLYVMDAGHNVIDKFAPTGTYLGQISGPFPGGGPLAGLAVDSNGTVHVDLGSTRFSIVLFDNSEANHYVTQLLNRANGSRNNDGTPNDGFAAGGPAGDQYELYSCGCIEKAGPNISVLGNVDEGPSDVAAAVDPANGHLYVDDQSSVSEWDTGAMNGRTSSSGYNGAGETSSGALDSSFGSFQLSRSTGQGGIAVNGSSGDIYVSNPADGKVYVFSTVAPVVMAGAAMNVTGKSATLHGSIDPRGVPVTSCNFEYGVIRFGYADNGPLDHKVPCAQTAAQIVSGTGPVAISAEVSGLQVGLLYRFRLNAGNANGSTPTSGRLATAGEGFGIKTFEVSFLNQDGTPDTQAGSHPYEMVTSIAYNTRYLAREATADSPYVLEPDGNLRDVSVDYPSGLVGDPNATPNKCTLAQLDSSLNFGGAENCPTESRVGAIETEFGGVDYNGEKGPLVNMVAPFGVAAQFAADFVGHGVFINAGVRAGGDYPVEGSSTKVSAVLPVIATRLTLFGVPPYGTEPRKPLLTLPTGCTGPLKATITADSYQQPGHFAEKSALTRDPAGNPLALTGCAKLQFPPTITTVPDTTNASTASGLTVGVHIPQKSAFNPFGLAESALRDTTVTLPEGVALNPAGADGLEACTSDPGALSEAQETEGVLGTPGDQIGFRGWKELNEKYEHDVQTATFTREKPNPLQPGVNFCPDGSKIGTVKLKTPLLEHELEGAVYLAAQNSNPFGSLVAMYIVAEDPYSGSLIKLTGEVKLSATGQIVTTFKNTPDLPFEELQLHFFGGERAPLTTPSRCGTYTTQASFVPWDGNGPVNTSSSFQIEHGPGGGPCPGARLPFSPSLTAGMTSIQAGGFSPFTMTMSRPDGSQNLQAIQLHMPAGLSGLLSGVKLCGEAEGNAGTCGPESLIGETIVSVGVGGSPFSVKGGKVYITGPYEGAPFGLSIVNPAKAGPFDIAKELGPVEKACDCIIVRAKIEVDPHTAALTITSDNTGPYKIPTILAGIPLQIQHVNVIVSRERFTFNPTNCNPMSITGSLSSTEGATDALSVPFQATNCATLGFAPKFAVSTSGKTSKARGASLSVKLTYPKAPFGSQANVARVKVDLPKQLPSRLTTLQKACTAAQFNANPAGCPAASVIGHAKAITPLVPVPLEGPAYFVSHGGEAFPSLIVVLQGYGVKIDLVGTTFISKAGITSSTFKTVPDAPVGSFELTLPEGKFSALGTNYNLCTQKLRMPTEFVAQNGTKINESTPIGVTGCSTAISIVGHKIKGRTLTVSVSVPASGKLTASGKGLSKASKTSKGRETVKLTLHTTKGGKFSTKVKLTFVPAKGKHQSKSLRVKFAK